MSDVSTAPAGWSWAQFEATASEAGQWLWGTVQGAFNEKASLSQIVVDAVIGMIPLVGDATAVRDLIAVSIGLIDDPAKREDKWQWVMLVVLIFALIPVIGGVIKGVGRLAIKVAVGAEKLRGAARIAHMQEAARDIVAFLNRVGAGNAEKWLLKLNVLEHQAAIMEHFNGLCYVINGALVQIERKLGGVLGESVLQRIQGLKSGFDWLHETGKKMIPQALKDLNDTLKEIQQCVRSGGETTSRTTSHAVTAGERAAATYTDELRLLEGAGATRTVRGGLAKNSSLKAQFEAKGLYKHEAGYPDLLKRVEKQANTGVERFPDVATYAGKIVNRDLEKGEQIFRVFGPVRKGGVHGFEQTGAAYAGGNPKNAAKFWGLGPPPKSAKEWRETSAVLDEWNHDSFILVGTVDESHKIKACTGKIAEQTGNKIPGQYLPGSGKQAMIETPPDLSEQLNALAALVMKDGQPRTLRAGGISWEIKPTGWNDAVGIHGYEFLTGPAAVQTARLGAREQATKKTRDQQQGAH